MAKVSSTVLISLNFFICANHDQIFRKLAILICLHTSNIKVTSFHISWSESLRIPQEMNANSSFNETGFNQTVSNQTDFKDGNVEYGICLSSTVLTLASSSVSLYVFQTYLNNLHEILKIILSVLCCHNIGTSIITGSILIYFQIVGQRNFVLCGFIQQTYVPTVSITFISISILSVVKYHIAQKTTDLEIVKKKFVLGMTFELS